MKKIDLSESPRQLTCMTYGASRSGKTRFLATWPKVRILADAHEKGWETIRTMPRDAFYEAGVLPEVWAIETPKDMTQAIEETALERQKDPNRILTLGIDSITFYADAYFDAMERLEPPGKPDTRKLYGLLLGHLRRMMIRTHAIGCNVVWTALAKNPEDGLGGVMIAGKSADKLPAACQYWFYMRAFNDGPNSVKREVRTRNYGPFPCGGRDGGILPDPLPQPTYKSLMACLTNTNTVPK